MSSNHTPFTSTPVDAPPASRGAGAPLLVVAVVSGVAGYAVLVVTARTLSPAANAEFLAFWGALFAVFGALVGTTAETTRAVHAGARPGGPGDGVRVLPTLAALGGIVAIVVAATGLAWGPQVLGPEWPHEIVLVAVGSWLFSVHCGLGGILVGLRRLRSYAVLVLTESLLRVLLVLVVTVWVAGVLPFAVASALAAGAWLLLSVSPGVRRLWLVRGDVALGRQVARFGAAAAASGASALLLVGFPILVRVTTDEVTFAAAAPLMLAVSLTRAPLLVPLGAYQNIVITQVAEHGWATLRRPVAVLGVATLAATLGAASLGPFLLDLVRPGYVVDHLVFGVLALAAGLAALLTLTGAATLALDRHRMYLVGWWLATIVAVGLLLTPYSLEARAMLALSVGPLVGVLAQVGRHLWSIRQNR